MSDRPTEATPLRTDSLPPRARCRSFCFLERDDLRWTVFLITFPGQEREWRGRFAFRPANSDSQGHEIHTADLFVEETEEELDQRARGLGRPLLIALLESALETYERRRGVSPDARRWFRKLLAQHAVELLPAPVDRPAGLSLQELRSLYESYRLDQVAHLIAMIRPDDFRSLVERKLDGRMIDFRASDRLQLAMLVVHELERHLRLPPFEVWVEDYLAHPEEYHRYTHMLHRGGELP